MKKKLGLDKELVSSDLDLTSLDGGTNSIACPTVFYPTCISGCQTLTCGTCDDDHCFEDWE